MPILLLVLLFFGCAPDSASDTLVVRIKASAERPRAAAAIRYEPADNVLAARFDARGSLVIERRDRSRELTVLIPELCPITLAAGPQRAPIDARLVFDLGRDRAPIGFDTPFTIHVRDDCPELGPGQIQWRQLEGAPLAELSVLREGYEVRARTPRFEALHPEPAPPGIVPISPRTQGRAVLEAVWQGPGSQPIRRTVTIVATSRATGLSSVAVSQQLMLSGADWRVQKAPQHGHAQVHASGALAMFTPDAPGRWTLAHGDGQTLVMQALWHDKTPYDCGRAECHASISNATRESPMSAALQRHLEAPVPAPVGCMLECHVLGERGAHDGGFTDVAAQLDFRWAAGTRRDDLPHPLRRLGGVRCTACHGPGVLPEPEGRELVLRSDVCATCHDAPPRYVHVEQWRASRMARSDDAPSTRTGTCAGCHTTHGFLERVANRAPRPQADRSLPIGIACAACHAPHSEPRGEHLVRTMPASAFKGGAAPSDPRSALCVACHAATEDQALPSSPSGALWQGQVRVPALDGEGWDVLHAAGTHGQVPGGCIGCHGASATGTLDHSFHIGQTSCTPCHSGEMSAQLAAGTRELEQRARALAQALSRACSTSENAGDPAHASARAPSCKSQRQARALFEVGLVLEDPAAFVHNAALARVLLEDAEAHR